MRDRQTLADRQAVYTHVSIRVEELSPGVASEHVDDDHLAPLLHIDQQVAQLAVVLVDQVDALWTNLLKGHDDAASNQLLTTEHRATDLLDKEETSLPSHVHYMHELYIQCVFILLWLCISFFIIHISS